MPNLFNLIKPRGEKESKQRNNFDLYNAHAYSQKVGTIMPIKALHVVPKDYFDINLSDFTQTTAMNSAAFVKARKELSAYFVPYNFIWSNYNQYQATREDPKSSLLQTRGIEFEPRISLWTLYLAASEFFAGYVYRHYMLRLHALNEVMRTQAFEPQQADPMSDPLYLDKLRELENTFDSQIYEAFFLLPTIFYRYTAAAEETHAWYEHAYNDVENRSIFLDVVGQYRVWSWVEKLDMLGYGNLYPFFTEVLRDDIIPRYNEAVEVILNREPVTWASLSSEYWKDDSNTAYDLFSPIWRTRVYLANMCSADNDRSQPRYVSVYPLYAYNHVFYHMFRNSYYDLDYNVQNYNVDFLNCTSFAGSVVPLSELPLRFFDLAHHQYKKDMFTGVLPDVQFGVVSSVNISAVNILSDANITSSGNTPLVVGTGSSAKLSINPNSSSDSLSLRQLWSLPNAFDVLALKRAEMLQVYHQNLMRAGNRTSDIFKAIYGSDPKSEIHNSPYFVDVLGEDFNLEPVIATAATGAPENGNLGDIGARGLMSGSRSFKFSSEDFGVLLFLGYVVPEPLYNSTRIDPHLMNLTPEDHLIPELMNLGFTPVLREWLCNYVMTANNNNTIRGYAPPYLEFKTDISLAHGAFSTARIPSRYAENVFREVRGSLAHWVVTRRDMQSEVATSLKTFYISPDVVDTIFVMADDGTPETDQFLCFTKINIDAVRQFSKLGLPSF